MMNAEIQPANLFALQDCERLLAAHGYGQGREPIPVDATLLAEVLAVAKRVRTWGG